MATYATPHIWDEHLDWGSFFIGPGRCFAIGNANDAQMGSVPVYKTTGQTPDQKVWLIEQVRYSDIAPSIRTLPLADAAKRDEQMRYHAGRKPLKEKEFVVAVGNRSRRSDTGNSEKSSAGIAQVRKTELESSANPQTGKSTGKSALHNRGFSGQVSDKDLETNAELFDLNKTNRPVLVVDVSRENTACRAWHMIRSGTK